MDAASWTGPSRLRSRNGTIRFIVAGHVLAGIRCGPLERPLFSAPAAYRSAHRFTVGQEHWNRAATSAIGTPWSTTSRATRRWARGVRAALAWDPRASYLAKWIFGRSNPPREALPCHPVTTTNRSFSTNLSGQHS